MHSQLGRTYCSKGDVEEFFDMIRRNLRLYPVPMPHLISILTFHLGKSFSIKVKTRLATLRDTPITVYELQALAEEACLLVPPKLQRLQIMRPRTKILMPPATQRITPGSRQSTLKETPPKETAPMTKKKFIPTSKTPNPFPPTSQTA